jgi:hypothetical protein
VASGWSDLLAEIGRQNASDDAPDAAALWRIFEEAAAASPRADELGYIRKLGATLSTGQQIILAGVIGTILDPIEWPEEWEQARQPLLAALEDVAKQAHPGAPGSLAVALQLEDDALVAVSHAVLVTARNLLKAPCPRDQLVFAARLCRLGNAGCFLAFGSRLRAVTTETESGVLKLARTRFEVAYQKYVQAARDMNMACGKVLFDGLDLRLEGA